MTYTLTRGASVHSSRVLSLKATHLNPNTGAYHEVSAVMLDTPRITDRHREMIGRAALAQLEAQGFPIGATDPTQYAARYAFPKPEYEVHAVTLTGGLDARTDYSETYAHGGGSLPAHTVFLDANGNTVTVPPATPDAP